MVQLLAIYAVDAVEEIGGWLLLPGPNYASHRVSPSLRFHLGQISRFKRVHLRKNFDTPCNNSPHGDTILIAKRGVRMVFILGSLLVRRYFNGTPGCPLAFRAVCRHPAADERLKIARFRFVEYMASLW